VYADHQWHGGDWSRLLTRNDDRANPCRGRTDRRREISTLNHVPDRRRNGTGNACRRYGRRAPAHRSSPSIAAGADPYRNEGVKRNSLSSPPRVVRIRGARPHDPASFGVKLTLTLALSRTLFAARPGRRRRSSRWIDGA